MVMMMIIEVILMHWYINDYDGFAIVIIVRTWSSLMLNCLVLASWYNDGFVKGDNGYDDDDWRDFDALMYWYIDDYDGFDDGHDLIFVDVELSGVGFSLRALTVEHIVEQLARNLQ